MPPQQRKKKVVEPQAPGVENVVAPVFLMRKPK
jgi:hypothetical protein